jgi:catechol 2,3-dioxygenase-like lactoylglutathione lyase family enzyme
MSELFHVGLTVSSLDRTTEFYRDVIGMRDDYDWNKRADWSGAKFGKTVCGVSYVQFQTETFGKLTHNPDAEIKTAYLSSDGGLLLQLTEYVQGGGEPVTLEHAKPGSPHFCFYVDDSAALREKLVRRGDVTILSELTQITSEMRSFYVADPDGVPIELLQRVKVKA